MQCLHYKAFCYRCFENSKMTHLPKIKIIQIFKDSLFYIRLKVSVYLKLLHFLRSFFELLCNWILTSSFRWVSTKKVVIDISLMELYERSVAAMIIDYYIFITKIKLSTFGNDLSFIRYKERILTVCLHMVQPNWRISKNKS